MRKGVVRDIKVGSVIATKLSGEAEVVHIEDSRNIRIKFIEYPYEVIVEAGQIRSGNVKNPMKPSVYGKGIIGVGPYALYVKKKSTKAYSVWCDMLRRVYYPKNETDRRNYNNVTICFEWHNFQNFAEWYYKQINHFGKVNFRWNLDKDMLIPGNQEYGPCSCAVIPEHINYLLNDYGFKRGNYPLGVTKINRKYVAHGSEFNVLKRIGVYPTIKQAQLAYWNHKFRTIRYAGIYYWKYLPESLAMRLINFGWEDAKAYYGDDARLWDC